MYVCVGDAEFPCFAAHLHHNHWMVERMYPAYPKSWSLWSEEMSTHTHINWIGFREISHLLSMMALKSPWVSSRFSLQPIPWNIKKRLFGQSPGITEPGNKKGMHSINIVSANLLATRRTWKFGNGGLQGTSMYNFPSPTHISSIYTYVVSLDRYVCVYTYIHTITYNHIHTYVIHRTSILYIYIYNCTQLYQVLMC